MRAYLKTKAGKTVTIITLLVLVISGLLLYKHTQDQQILDHRVNGAVTMKSNKAAMQTPKDDQIKPFTNSDLIRNKKKALSLGVDKYPNGYLIIPSAGIRLPIYNRANNYTLALGVGKSYYLDSEMAKGNFVVAGHNMERHGVLLSDLYEANLGQEIILTGYNGQQYKYRITSKKIVSPYVKLVDGKPVAGSAFYMPKENEKPIVTVYTCAAGGLDRLVVQGILEN